MAGKGYNLHHIGVVAQLVERSVRNAEVRGSTPLGSTIFPHCHSRAGGNPNLIRAVAGKIMEFAEIDIPLFAAQFAAAEFGAHFGEFAVRCF